MANGLAEFSLDLNAIGMGSKLVVNGEDVSDHVYAVSVDCSVDDVTSVTIRMRGGGTIAGHGIVRVVPELDETELLKEVNDRVAVLLDSLDPEEIDRTVLDNAGFGQPAGTAQLLEEIKRRLFDA